VPAGGELDERGLNVEVTRITHLRDLVDRIRAKGGGDD
jgi:hypothetical protein